MSKKYSVNPDGTVDFPTGTGAWGNDADDYTPKGKGFGVFKPIGGAVKAYKPACYTTHPGLPIKEFVVYGGSCYSPMVKDADVYIALDPGAPNTKASWPWTAQTEVLFPITDMSVPKSKKDFLDLIDWTAEQILAGKKVHVGCIGGHGRTGMVLAALVFVIAGTEDAITYVRKHYCQKAVETAGQVAFLNKAYGIKVVAGHKSHYAPHNSKYPADSYFPAKGNGPPPSPGTVVLAPMRSTLNIWSRESAE